MDHASAGETLTNLETRSEVSNNMERPKRSGPGMADDGGASESDESERQRTERLGRERPAKLKSIGAEIFFCYSIIASQFMAVSCSGTKV